MRVGPSTRRRSFGRTKRASRKLVARLQTQAKTLDRHAGDRLEVEVGHPLKTQALIEPQRGRVTYCFGRDPHGQLHRIPEDPRADIGEGDRSTRRGILQTSRGRPLGPAVRTHDS